MTSILRRRRSGRVRPTVDGRLVQRCQQAFGSSQSAVSKSVARLERRLGVRLIQRSTRTLKLTAEGHAYYERGGAAAFAASRRRKTRPGGFGAKGLLRVSAPQEFGRMLIARWAPEFFGRAIPV